MRPKKAIRRGLELLRTRGSERVCPICERQAARFLPYRNLSEPERRCAGCGSLERHRLLWVALSKRDAFRGRDLILHVAPEPCLEGRLRERLGNRYLTLDLNRPTTQLRADLTNLPFKDGSVDAVICSHVLEHIPNDRGAIRELYRVLKPSGWAALLVPIMRPNDTEEDPSVQDPEERLKRYGHREHVRKCLAV